MIVVECGDRGEGVSVSFGDDGRDGVYGGSSVVDVLWSGNVVVMFEGESGGEERVVVWVFGGREGVICSWRGGVVVFFLS